MKTMESFEYNGSTVCHKIYDPNIDTELDGLLKGNTLKNFIDSIGKKVVLVLGGDGTMLSAIRENYDKNLPFLGINFGSVGFLLNHKKALEETNYSIRKYPLLEVYNNGKHLGVAFNDINIYPTSGNLIELDVGIGNRIEAPFSGDGILIATPAGSTGHSKSYGATTLAHTSNHLLLTLKGGNPSKAPKLISDSSPIKVENINRLHDIGINLDGQVAHKTKTGEEISLGIQKYHNDISLLIANNYLQEWDTKVLEA